MQNEAEIINALWDADHKGFNRPLRKAIMAARSGGLTNGQIAAELKTTPDKLAELTAQP
jgi:hypothetical protein